MDFDPKNAPRNLHFSSDWMMHRVLATLIFDVFVRSIIHERYSINPAHVTLQADRSGVVLFIQDDSDRSFMFHDDDLHRWVLEFVASEMFGIDPEAVEMVYLDGVVGEQDPYLYIAGDGILISSGQPSNRGKYL